MPLKVGKEVAFTLLAAGIGKFIGKLATTPDAKKLFQALQNRLKDGGKKLENLVGKAGNTFKNIRKRSLNNFESLKGAKTK